MTHYIERKYIISLNNKTKKHRLCPRIYEDIPNPERVDFPRFALKSSKSYNLFLQSMEKYEVSTNNILSMTYAKTCEKGTFQYNKFSC